MSADEIGTIVGARISGPGRELLPVDGPYDVFIEGGRIVDLAPTGFVASRGRVLRADGSWLIPGLWDHHVHVVQAALGIQRVDLRPAESAVGAAAAMASAPILPDGRRVGAGFRDAFWSQPPTLEVLDAVTGAVPTYLINADVHSVWLNSAALRREGFESLDQSGILREEAAFEVSRRLNAVDPTVADAAVEALAARAAARGVVGIVDFEMAYNVESWQRRIQRGFDLLRVSLGTYPDLLERLIGDGWRTGDHLSDLVSVGPLKVITDGSLGTRTAACSHPYPGGTGDHGILNVAPDQVRELMLLATANGLECAIHAIGDVANSHALDAFAVTGATGTIEHAQLVAAVDIPRFVRLRVAASVQPEHAIDDRDLADDIWATQSAIAYPLGALASAGVNLRFGSDAPVSPLDPWAAIAAAVFRTRDGREPWRAEQAVAMDTALAASTLGGSTSGQRIEVGAHADLALCAVDPLTADEPGLRTMDVTATLLAGRMTHGDAD